MDEREVHTSESGKDAPPPAPVLAQLIDAQALQSMLDDFYHLTSVPSALIALDGEIIVGAGWQDVCTRFHRIHPTTCAYCIESDTELSAGVPAGESRLYRCKNGMWDAAMPVFLAEEHVANVFTGQFFFDDEEIDTDFFRAQADKYGFPEEEYVGLIASVPRLSHEVVSSALGFLTKLAAMLSRLTFANSELTTLAAQRETMLAREREQTEQLRALAEVESVLTTSLDFTEVVGLALQAAEAHLGVHASSIWTLDALSERLSIVGSRGFPDSFASDFRAGLPITEAYPVARAARERTSILYENVSESDLHGPVRDAYARYGIELGTLSVVPLISRDSVIGAMTLAWPARRTFRDDDLVIIDTLASRFGVALENARLFQSEHMIAETLQDTLVVLPDSVDGIAFSRAYESATYESGRVGGDFVDIFPVGDGVVGVTLGDVSGKGLEAAVTTSTIRTALRVHAMDGLTPAQILSKANEVMRRFSPVDSFVTLWFGLLCPRTRELHYESAGHPPPFVVPAGGEIRELNGSGPMLGAFSDVEFVDRRAVLALGDRLVLYSDGATEARSPAGLFLGNRLTAMIAAHREEPTARLSAAVMADVVEYSAGVLRDDVAILVVEPQPGAAG